MARRTDHEEIFIGRLLASAAGLLVIAAGYGLFRLGRFLWSLIAGR
jgi:hypothetical protein